MQKLYDVRMMTQLQYSTFTLQYLFFVQRQLKILNNLYCHLLSSLFILPPKHSRKVSPTNFLLNNITIINRILLKISQMFQPFFVYHLTLKIILFFRIQTITMFEYNPIKILLNNSFNSQPLQINHLQRFFSSLMCKYKHC